MRKLTFTLVTFFAMMLPMLSFGQIYDPGHWSFSSESLGNNEYNVIFKAEIEAGWHTYSQNIPDGGPVPTTFYFNEVNGYERVGEVVESAGIVLHDAVFDMDLKFFEKEAIFTQKVKVLGKEPVTVKGEVEFMVCNDGQCLPPTPVEFEVSLGDGSVMASDTEEAGGDSLLGMILQAIMWGLAALLTPCVFPMIPMTVSFFLHGSENKAAGRFKAIMYFIFIASYSTGCQHTGCQILSSSLCLWSSLHLSLVLSRLSFQASSSTRVTQIQRRKVLPECSSWLSLSSSCHSLVQVLSWALSLSSQHQVSSGPQSSQCSATPAPSHCHSHCSHCSHQC